MNIIKRFFKQKPVLTQNITHIYDANTKENVKVENTEVFKYEHIYIDYYVLREKDNNYEAETLFKQKLHELCEFLYDTNFYVAPDCACRFSNSSSQLGFNIKPLHNTKASISGSSKGYGKNLHNGDYLLKINKNKLMIIEKDKLDCILCTIEE